MPKRKMTTKVITISDYREVTKAINDYLAKNPRYIFEGSTGERNPDGTSTQTLRFYRLIDK